ncbi:peptidoglycan DD-metalloendopeptidase family protein [Solirubrobacter ginsenosidimutans]|uniref:Peptidoglycan DD-metalloendopeptidase family protein n=1 Tax=Solirubrobacter ginsenosidimutans TaxID=490573 RepID=A0A9X3S4W3_9ACTN|nr:peptidoglycan-binding protein [Solirubrobacter ginsenosidimutans]MDA0161023.1 peptidoglycan DD-metalloendopeptidase family protein [Solirubrobacter ginsenosidimutans]
MSAATVAACLFVPATASAASSRVAALQVALRAHGAYAGAIDGLSGPGTTAGVRQIQRRAGLVADGIVGPQTRRALGAQGRHPIGSRPLRAGLRGWDVAALQFALETHGFPCGTVDGGFGARTTSAVERLQAFAGLAADGVAGPATLAALSRPPVRAPALRKPIAAPLGDRYGPRGNQFHAGLDFPAATGTSITAAASGRVIFSGYDDGWGLTVVLDHGNGVHTRYAHLSAAAVTVGASVGVGSLVGRVGQTGFATGPHLHFEVTVRGAYADPGLALGLY